MELIEMEMVRRLQNTQNLQRSALNELEKAVAIPTGDLLQTTSFTTNNSKSSVLGKVKK